MTKNNELTSESIREAIAHIKKLQSRKFSNNRYIMGIEILLPVWRELRKLGLKLSRVKGFRIVTVSNERDQLAELYIALPNYMPKGVIVPLYRHTDLTKPTIIVDRVELLGRKRLWRSDWWFDK